MTFTVKHILFRCIHTALRMVHIDAFWRRSGYSYVPDYYGRAAHKQIDIRRLPGFGCLADTVIQQGKSSLYYDRLHVIYQAIANSHFTTEENPGTVNLVEVGVYKGRHELFHGFDC